MLVTDVADPAQTVRRQLFRSEALSHFGSGTRLGKPLARAPSIVVATAIAVSVFAILAILANGVSLPEVVAFTAGCPLVASKQSSGEVVVSTKPPADYSQVILCTEDRNALLFKRNEPVLAYIDAQQVKAVPAISAGVYSHQIQLNGATKTFYEIILLVPKHAGVSSGNGSRMTIGVGNVRLLRLFARNFISRF